MIQKEARLLRIGVVGAGPVSQAAHFDACRKARKMVLTQKDVEGKLERVDLHRKGKDHAKDTANRYRENLRWKQFSLHNRVKSR